MPHLVHHLVTESAARQGAREALKYRNDALTYAELDRQVAGFARSLLGLGLARAERVAIYAEKRAETVVAIFGAAAAGGVYVPVNPLLKAEQVGYILADCNVRVLVTTAERLPLVAPVLAQCPDLRAVVLIGEGDDTVLPGGIARVPWGVDAPAGRAPHRVIDGDVAAILYTSGSTGKPKGVVLSHRNVVAGAQSVASYLENNSEDALLSALPLSFDAGFSQLTTAFLVGARVVLINYLLPRDVIVALERERITGLTAVPPLWIQLAQLKWPESIGEHLRYIANTGGRMPRAALDALRGRLPKTRPFLMYGLTEAFRSTYLPPEEVDRRPDSIGKAIPNAEILVVREDGTPCEPGEPGELVHRGVLVSLGYWNDPATTAERFKPAPGQDAALPVTELAVWSGDTVKMDEEGFLYFVSRRDEMIKTSGYRVSPTEVEEVVYATGLVGEAAAMGIDHPVLGQAIVVVATPRNGAALAPETLRAECQKRLPAFMVPSHVEIVAGSLPRNPNGKIDRQALATARASLFGAGSA